MIKKFKIDNYSLPNDWIDKINNFDIEHFDNNTKSFINKLISEIKHCSDNALGDFVIQNYVKHVCCDEDLLFNYKTVNKKLMIRVMSEINNQKIYKFTEKLMSTIAELTTYNVLKNENFTYIGQTNIKDSTDLIMSKNNKTYDIQIKYKQSPQTLLVLIEKYIKGMALLKSNTFLRDKKITVILNKDIIYKTERKQIFEIILPNFISQQKDSCDSNLLQIIIEKGHKCRDIETVAKELEAIHVQESSVSQIQNHIKNGFLRYPIEGLKKQYKNRNKDNKFIGVIVLERDFYRTFTIEDIELVFKYSWLEEFDLKIIVQDSFSIVHNFLVHGQQYE